MTSINGKDIVPNFGNEKFQKSFISILKIGENNTTHFHEKLFFRRIFFKNAIFELVSY